VALAHGPLHHGRAGLGGRVKTGPTPFQPELNILLPVLQRVMNFVRAFVIGRVLSGAGAGGAQARPSVRWDGLPGRRSHSSMTPWALGLISTVRIGAGAWRMLANTRESGDTDQASTNLHDAQKRTQEQKEKRAEAFNKRRGERSREPIPAHARINHSTPTRATPLHSLALRAANAC
jgi:hypothetical protein